MTSLYRRGLLQSVGATRAGVATPARGLVDSPTCCLRCGYSIPKPRPWQKACSAKCRWALWAAIRRREAEGLREGLLLLRAQVDDLLARHDARSRPRR
jgi:predicted nucleic acid-binding Zn ribbon protein